MSVGVLAPSAKWTGFDDDGNPLSGGLLYTYAAGTSTPLNTYSDVGLTVPNANPVVLDAGGRATIYLTPATAYKFVLKDSLLNTIFTQDNITVAAVSDVVTKIIAGTGVSITSTGAVAGTGDVTVNSTGAVVVTGAILPYGGVSAPSGYFLCDGTAYNRVTYAALFAVIAVAFGAGDGANTFNVPDLRQRFPIGKAASGTGSTLGGTGGTVDHVHTGPSHTHTGPSHTHTGPSHTHTGPSHTHTFTSSAPSAVMDGGPGDPISAGYWATADHYHTGTSDAGGTGATGASGTAATGADGTGATGADGTGNTGTGNPPFQAVNYIIKS